MTWKVLQDGKSIKTYPTREQAVIWCYEMRLVIEARRKHYLANGIEIVEVQDEKADKQGEKPGYATAVPFSF